MGELCWVLSAKGQGRYRNEMKQNIILALWWVAVPRER